MRAVTILSILLLLAPVTPSLGAPQSDTRLEGRVLGFDGLSVTGYSVHLIDETGMDSARAEVDADGVYRMREVPAGRYDLALETPEGRFARVEASPVRVRSGHLVRRDLVLVENDPAHPMDVALSASFGAWWAGLDKPAKVWTVVAVVMVLGITAEALSSDETLASPFTSSAP